MCNKNIPSDGELLRAGKERLANLGVALRSEYVENKKFLPKSFADNSFYFTSTSSRRTKDSILSFCYGFFPPRTGPQINGQYIFPDGIQPVPIHCQSEKEDFLLEALEICPKVTNIISKSAAIKNIQKLLADHKPLMDDLRRLTNTTANGPELIAVLDTIKVLREMNDPRYPVPDGITDSMIDESVFLFKKLISEIMVVEEDGFCPAVSGDAIEEMFFKQHERDKWEVKKVEADSVNGTNQEKKSAIYPKYRHYSAHDITLLSIGRCLGLPPSEKAENGSEIILHPNYGSLLIVEFHVENGTENDIENPKVKFLYDFDVNKNGKFDLHEFIPSFCSQKNGCDLKTMQSHFSAIHEMKERDIWVTEGCGLLTRQPMKTVSLLTYQMLAAIFIAAFVVTFVCLIVFTVISCVRMHSDRQKRRKERLTGN
eukprot:MONOS_13772.1-p1 / transcript=MONOS_13772.1 / gene=MONOS_13772 / organism=Monocercomonoides_exilis_PA203 / gene_product=unspecified product / transcript_product=unspecified product / location=Mono_scaffold00880:18662-20953(+) / protein_length=426 / sequence_SO=supercontig / SO=protein_coding / is_pseudo=false